MSTLPVTKNRPLGLMSASFEERSAWIQLLSLSIVLGWYTYVAWQMWAKGVKALVAYVPVFAVGVVLMVIVLVVGHIVVAIASRPEGRDERDRLISWRAESRSGWVLATGVLAGIASLVVSWPTVWTAHVLLFSLFASELLKVVLQLVSYRRGI